MSPETFNYIEAIIWFCFSLALLLKAVKLGKNYSYFKNCLLCSVGFFAFGISDLIEVKTGAWWKPAELLILKAACIILFVYCAYFYLKPKK